MSALLSISTLAQSMNPPSAALTFKSFILPVQRRGTVKIALVEYSKSPLDEISQENWIVVNDRLMDCCVSPVSQCRLYQLTTKFKEHILAYAVS